MPLVLIAGASELFSELPREVLQFTGDRIVHEGIQVRSAHVDDAAIASIAAIGLDVEVVLTDQDHADRLTTYPGGDDPLVG